VLTYALLDSMSDIAFVTNQVVSKLQTATSKPVSLKLTTMTADNLEMRCKVYNNLTIRGLNMHEQIQVGKTYSTDSILINKQHIPTPEIANIWPHLKCIAGEIPQGLDIEIGMFIGYDRSSALVLLETKIGLAINDPFALRTPLGWCIENDSGKHETN